MTQNELRKYLQSLQRVLASIQKQTETIAKNSESQKDTGDVRDARPLDVLVSKLTLPVAVDEYCKSHRGEQPRGKWGWLRLAMEVAGLGALAAYAIVTAWTLSEIKKQAHAAQDQAGFMQRQLEATGRPWLGLNPSVKIERITVSKGGMGADLVVPVKNYGVSPATYVGVGVIIGTANDSEGMSQRFRNTSDIACMANPNGPNVDRGRGVGGVVFPGVSVSERMGISISNGPITPSDRVQIIGCIVYEFPAEKIHQTRFCLESDKPAGDFSAGDALFACRFGNTAN